MSGKRLRGDGVVGGVVHLLLAHEETPLVPDALRWQTQKPLPTPPHMLRPSILQLLLLLSSSQDEHTAAQQSFDPSGIT